MDVLAYISRGLSTLTTFVAVYVLFGPTYPGIYNQERGIYTPFYPGLSFAFPIPTQYADCCHNQEGIGICELRHAHCSSISSIFVHSISVRWLVATIFFSRGRERNSWGLWSTGNSNSRLYQHSFWINKRATFFFGYPNVAYEVMKNGHIATVTLFQL